MPAGAPCGRLLSSFLTGRACLFFVVFFVLFLPGEGKPSLSLLLLAEGTQRDPRRLWVVACPTWLQCSRQARRRGLSFAARHVALLRVLRTARGSAAARMQLWRERTSERRDGLTAREKKRKGRYPVVPSVRQGGRGGLERTPGPATQPGSGIAAAMWGTHAHSHTHTHTYSVHTTREPGRSFVTQVRTHTLTHSHSFGVPRSAKAQSRPCQGKKEKMGWWRTGSATAAT